MRMRLSAAVSGSEVTALSDRGARRWFWGLWLLLIAARALLAVGLPLFGDEAFYAWESRRLAWAYSDLPGATAWSIALGRALIDSELGIRLSSLLLAALLPLQLLRIADAAGLGALRWRIGLLALLLPLLSTNGLLALPEPLLLMAAALCLHALLRLQALGPGRELALILPVLVELGLGLALGAFSHYRFLAVIGAGGLAVLWVPAARALLADWRIGLAAVLGLCAWLPLLMFDAQGEQAGWRFQFVDRHPWAFQPVALAVPIEQALVATPLAWLLMLMAVPAALRERSSAPGPALLAAAGASLLLGLYLVGLFADRERVSFHWPLVGQMALLPLLAVRLHCAGVRLRMASWTLLCAGALLAWSLLVALSLPQGRAWLAGHGDLADNFLDSAAVHEAVQAQLQQLPAGTRVVADNALLAARLVQARGGDADFGVLEHPRNAKHGRARQLELWAMLPTSWRSAADPARLLVVEETALGLRLQQPWQQAICDVMPGLQWADEVQLHGGSQRYLLFVQRGDGDAVCERAALAYLDEPGEGAQLPRRFALRGWAIRDGEGLARVEVLLDGIPVAEARTDIAVPGVRAQWPGSNDPRHPHVGIAADVEVPPTLRGELQVSLRLTGVDGDARVLPMARVQVEEP
jgi:4-amino-4-deoxy-L-arabinose transferase-like glycosyltransferase